MRPVLFRMLVLISLLLSACTPAGSPAATLTLPAATDLPAAPSPAPATPEPQPSPTMAPTPGITPAQTGTAIQSSDTFRFLEGNPVLSGKHTWDGQYIDPGAIVFHDGLYHMFYNGIQGFPSPVGVGYATSADGIHWEPQVTEPLFHAGDLYPNDAGVQNLFVTSGLVQPDGVWVLYYYTLHGGNFIGAQEIGRATAPDPKGPWKADPQFALNPGPAGAWDSLQVGSPDVLQTANGYVMYYDGMPSGGPSQIGMATSADGIHWTKYNDPATTDPVYAESDPVLAPTAQNWDSHRVIDPNVEADGSGWKMIYLSTGCTSGKFGSCEYDLGQAASPDGIHWEKSPQKPVLSSANVPDWGATYLVTLVQQGGADFIYMDYSCKFCGGTKVYLAVPRGWSQP